MSLKQILGAIRKADLDYNLIQDGDRIAVGVSGGKDSLLLLYSLHLYQKIAYRYDQKKFEVVGIHLEMGFPNMDFQFVRDFAKQNGIEYHDYPTKLYEILKLYPNKNGNIQCSRCSTLKKGAIVKAAKELNCNKTAFGHHADDAIETLFLNLIYGGKLNTFEPAMHLSNTGMDFIRPFIYCYEENIRNTAVNELRLPVVKSTCPNDGFTKRQDIKDLLGNIYQTYPIAKKNFLTAISNQEQLKLWVKGIDWKNKQ